MIRERTTFPLFQYKYLYIRIEIIILFFTGRWETVYNNADLQKQIRN